MLNKEYYKDLLVEFAVNGDKLALINGIPSNCIKSPCDKCDFKDVLVNCNEIRKRWANSEYVEPRIHWEDVPVDTPVYVKICDRPNMRRHFAKYDAESNLVKVFDYGKSSFTVINKDDVTGYSVSDVLLAKEEDKRIYYWR